MKVVLTVFAILLAAACGWFIYNGFETQTAFPSADAPAGFAGVANLQAMHIQMADFVIGVGAGVASAVLFGAAAVVGVIDRWRNFNE